MPPKRVGRRASTLQMPSLDIGDDMEMKFKISRKRSQEELVTIFKSD